MVDGLKGFPEAINAVFPQTIVQTCIVHLIRQFDGVLPPGRIARAWRRRCGLFIARPMPLLARLPSTPLRKVRGVQSIRQSRRAGAATGSS